jgi:hypothetical protein
MTILRHNWSRLIALRLVEWNTEGSAALPILLEQGVKRGDEIMVLEWLAEKLRVRRQIGRRRPHAA